MNIGKVLLRGIVGTLNDRQADPTATRYKLEALLRENDARDDEQANQLVTLNDRVADLETRIQALEAKRK